MIFTKLSQSSIHDLQIFFSHFVFFTPPRLVPKICQYWNIANYHMKNLIIDCCFQLKQIIALLSYTLWLRHLWCQKLSNIEHPLMEMPIVSNNLPHVSLGLDHIDANRWSQNSTNNNNSSMKRSICLIRDSYVTGFFFFRSG